MRWQIPIDQLRSIDLKIILRLAGAVRDRYDKNKWRTDEGIISASGQKFYNWSQSRGGGGAIDLVMHLKKCNFTDAVHWLLAYFPRADMQRDGSPGPAQPRPALRLPPRDDSKLGAVIHYLVIKRQLDRSLVQSLIDCATLYADPKSNAVFLLLGKEKRVAGAELRGTSSSPWRGMAPGSTKDRGYFSIQLRKTTTVVLTESAIDAISCLILYPNCMAISTSGANPNPAWLELLLHEGYAIFCGFDSDHTGDKLAEKMILLHPAIKRLRPAKKDWNDLLKAAKCSAHSKGQFN